jgi:hypothetical protein
LVLTPLPEPTIINIAITAKAAADMTPTPIFS